MKYFPALLLVVACGGPSQQQLAETPSARSRPPSGEAPAASTSDRDREGVRQSFEDMDATQRARAEAKNASTAPPPGAGSGSGSAAPVKKGPAIEAPKD